MELVKTQMQVCGRTGISEAVRHILREGGPGGLARGLAVTVTREVPAFGIYFGSYEYVIRYGSNVKRETQKAWPKFHKTII